MHKLALVALIGLTGSAACFGAAAAIGGKDFGNGFDGLSLFDGRPRCEAVPGANAAVRDLDWDGSDHVGLSVLGPATYTPGSGDKLHATGDPQVLAHLRIRDGNIEMDCRGWRNRTGDVTLTLPGREFRKFALNGGGNLTLNNLNQADLSIGIGGAGKVRANGKVEIHQACHRRIGQYRSGPDHRARGKADIGGSGTIRAKGTIDDIEDWYRWFGAGRFWRGNLEQGRSAYRRSWRCGHCAHRGGANIHIGGSGDVTLHSNPKELETHIGGSGQIHRAAS